VNVLDKVVITMLMQLECITRQMKIGKWW